MPKLTSLVPRLAKRAVRSTNAFLKSIPYRGSGRFCPVCGKVSRRFASAGEIPRPNARCVHCGSLERHRFLWRYIERYTKLLSSPARVLHFAPETCLVRHFQATPALEYVTADLEPCRAMVQVDITRIGCPSSSFDVVICSHVLEHIPNDRLAIRELFRVLKPSGYGLVIVPIMRDVTFEDPSITDPVARSRAFGQSDHVRVYGRDFPSRLREVGFSVEPIVPSDIFTPLELETQGIPLNCEPLYRVTRGADHSS